MSVEETFLFSSSFCRKVALVYRSLIVRVNTERCVGYAASITGIMPIGIVTTGVPEGSVASIKSNFSVDGFLCIVGMHYSSNEISAAQKVAYCCFL